MQLQAELHTPVKLGLTGACYLTYPPPVRKSQEQKQASNKENIIKITKIFQ
ncbi:hypothetical protein CGSMWGv00703Dmash_00324 [Gardnerella greenwoodii 00703Dmash]|uniref:Uncharacterized protein n=1 Tax=Gardnerella greenwoodii 00703Dmash TaxID=698960 RepID=I4MBX8_9BIFI|nr:hypothetical protein CGSMWGv00703Dmash_00324 [Gardnerella greenwoodii 00703Dmash]